MATKTYRAKDVVVFYGNQRLQMIAEDGVEVTYESDSWSDDPALDTGGSRAYNNDKRADITITLQKTSPSNDYLDEQRRIDEVTGANKLPLIVKDTRGNELHSTPEAWIKKPPDASFGRETPTRAWTFRTLEMDSIYGGNPL